MSVLELSGACFIDTSPSANGSVSFVISFFRKSIRICHSNLVFSLCLQAYINHFCTLEVKAKHKDFHSALRSFKSLMGGWVDWIFFLPNHVFLIPEVLLTEDYV